MFSEKKSNEGKNLEINWLHYGYCNSKLFHSFANGHKSKNQISSLLIDGSHVDNMQKTETETLSFFKQLYTDNCPSEARFSIWTGKSMSQKEYLAGNVFFEGGN